MLIVPIIPGLLLSICRGRKGLPIGLHFKPEDFPEFTDDLFDDVFHRYLPA